MHRSCPSLGYSLAIPLYLAMGIALLGAASFAGCKATTGDHSYTYGRWLMSSSEPATKPRGGTTKGEPVVEGPFPYPGWTALQDPKLSNVERDRRAILAMAGTYRAQFEFLETIPFKHPYRFDRPYRSWATEIVIVLADTLHFISLQHILVMRFQKGGQKQPTPIVMKHWRQDWTYEDKDLHVFLGRGRWTRHRPTGGGRQGKWSQAVFQVDDSPRYEALGRWRHEGGVSTWVSEETTRPLPRREFSVRNDYHVLVGTNRHTITPHGWVHEQSNAKLALSPLREDAAPGPLKGWYLAREIGINRYTHLQGFDASAGMRYWDQTRRYWQAVRAAWRPLFEQCDTLTLKKTVGGRQSYELHFEQAGRLTDPKTKHNPTDVTKRAAATVQAFVASCRSGGGPASQPSPRPESSGANDE